MEHRATSTLSWSAPHQGYELSDPQRGEGLRLMGEDPAWFAWLEVVSSFAFHGQNGSFTARKETKQRGAGYWYAYRKREGILAKTYLGKTADLTFARLEGVARVLQAPRASAARAPAPLPPAALRETSQLPMPEESREADSLLGLVPPAPAHPRGELLAPLLATKLHQPRPRAQLVARVHLVERLQQGLSGTLTLASAPAGFGKTTLISQWLAGYARPAAWLSLDERDNDPARFLTYLIAALQTIAPTLGKGVVGALQSPQPPPAEPVLTAVLNDITASIADPFVLVLDDYHLIDAQPVDHTLTFLLDHLPPQMHLVIATREDPPLPLARLRASGQLTELRTADLRFTPVEAADFLTQAMGLSLSADDVAALEARTEGWIAGLQLAAISLQGHPNPARFITEFTGSHRFVMDYLAEEVLQRQPEHVQVFLLRTSILDRLCGPLCDAVLLAPSSSGQATLEYLERANLFIVPLDHERRWYRYHHLFAELLQQRLEQSLAPSPADTGQVDERQGDVAQIHQRASVWYEEQGLELEAFQHAAAAHDVDRATRLVEGNGMPLHFRGAVAPVLDWLNSLPSAVLDTRPVLWTAYASVLLATGRVPAAEEKLLAAEKALQGAKVDDTIRDLIGRIAANRATAAASQQQVETIIAQSQRALENLHPNNLAFRTSTAWKLGFAYQLKGNRAEARQAYIDVIAIAQASGNLTFEVMATIGLGQMQEADNQLDLAAETYRRVLQLLGEPPLPFVSEAHLGLARICYEWNDLGTAEHHAQQSVQFAGQLERTDRLVASEVVLARLRLAQGDAAGATALLDQAGQSARHQNFVDRIPEIVDAQVLILLREGQLAAAAELAERHNLPISQARVYLAAGNPSAALAALQPWRQQVEAKGWKDARLKVLVLQALTLQAQGARDKAVHVLLDALALAEPGGFIRTFVDEDGPMAHLVSAAAAHGRKSEYITKVLVALEASEQGSEGRSQRLPASSAQPLIEALSTREAEVLKLMAQGCSNQEIAGRLFLALDTVKWHNRHIFAKLQVQRRTQAVARAAELGLL
jgi:LuxR family maltose regulon positive regulatory protein